MTPLADTNKIEKILCEQANLKHDPIGGTFELLPVCNMNCKMCYIRMSMDEMKKQGNLLSMEEWIWIAEQAVENGLLFLLLTGGEPLLYPDFIELYKRLHAMGLVISINTNATLLNETIANVLADNVPRRVNMTIYGASDTTYETLCSNSKGFSQFMNAFRMLKERKIPIKWNYSVTPYNINDYKQIIRLAEKENVMLDVASYMFPPVRKKGNDISDFERLSPQAAAKVYVKQCHRMEGIINFHKRMKRCDEYRKHQTNLPQEMSNRIPCKAGSCTWWINWKGQMTPCGMMEEPMSDVLNDGFMNAWLKVNKKFEEYHISDTCAKCGKKKYCIACAASAYTETGRIDGTPGYQCELTDEIIRLSKKYIL